MKKNNKWYLYWVTSYEYEDCFVVAQNAQAAKSFEFEVNGFEWSAIKAQKVMEVPERYDKIENYLWIRWSRIHAPEQAKVPNIHRKAYYAGRWMLERLGAKWRSIDGREQMLLLDQVYTHNEEGEACTYSIGARALVEDSNKHIKFDYNDYSMFEEDIEKILYEMMGLATAQCHEIEFYFANSFVFAVSEKQKKKYDTIREFLEGWRKKTLGNLISSIEESFEIKGEWKIWIKGFIELRNQFVHGLTTKERYNMRDEWGRRELISFLAIFLKYCEPVKAIAESCFLFSIKFANEKLIEDGEEKLILEETEDVKGKLALFGEVFELKGMSNK